MNLQVEAEVERNRVHLQIHKCMMPTSELGLGTLRGKRQSDKEGQSHVINAENHARSFQLQDRAGACTLGSSGNRLIKVFIEKIVDSQAVLRDNAGRSFILHFFKFPPMVHFFLLV